MKNGIKVEDNALIGMGSIVMDDCDIETGSSSAARAVLLEGSKEGKAEIWVGAPAKKVKDISPELFHFVAAQ